MIWIISTRWPSIVPRVSADAVDEGPRSLGYWLKGHITRIGRGKERCAPLVWGSLLVVPTWNIWLPFTSNYHLSEDRLSGLVDKPWGQGLDIWLRATSVEGSPRPLTYIYIYPYHILWFWMVLVFNQQMWKIHCNIPDLFSLPTWTFRCDSWGRRTTSMPFYRDCRDWWCPWPSSQLPQFAHPA